MIELLSLTKRYGEETAVNRLSFRIQDGEFFGLLGPNGSGKTTTIRMLSTVLLPTAGEIRIDGMKLTRGAAGLRRKLSVITQEYSMRLDMNMDEVMEYQGRLYRMKKQEIREKTESLLAYAGLLGHRRKRVRDLSGGMKRRLMICRGLMVDPEVLLLDEPTAGMDAISRRQTWNLLRRLKENKISILLTTHYMEEAEQLCDRVAFIRNGSLERMGVPSELIADLGRYAVDDFDGERIVSRYFHMRKDAIAFLTRCKDGASLRNTNLEDVFIHGYCHGFMGEMDGVQT